MMMSSTYSEISKKERENVINYKLFAFLYFYNEKRALWTTIYEN